MSDKTDPNAKPVESIGNGEIKTILDDQEIRAACRNHALPAPKAQVEPSWFAWFPRRFRYVLSTCHRLPKWFTFGALLATVSGHFLAVELWSALHISGKLNLAFALIAALLLFTTLALFLNEQRLKRKHPRYWPLLGIALLLTSHFAAFSIHDMFRGHGGEAENDHSKNQETPSKSLSEPAVPANSHDFVGALVVVIVLGGGSFVAAIIILQVQRKNLTRFVVPSHVPLRIAFDPGGAARAVPVVDDNRFGDRDNSHVAPAQHMIIPVSAPTWIPGRDTRGAICFPEFKDGTWNPGPVLRRTCESLGDDIKALAGLGPRVNWTQILRSIAPHKNELQSIWLLGSKGIDRPSDLKPGPLKWDLSRQLGSRQFLALCAWLIKPYVPSATIHCCSGYDLDFEDAGLLFLAIDSICQDLVRDASESSILLDVTGGIKVASIVAAASTMNRDICFQYVSTVDPEIIHHYDMRIELPPEFSA